MQQNRSKIEFKLDTDTFNKYKIVCENNGYDMSKRLRQYVISEIDRENKYSTINVTDIIHKPISKSGTIEINGRIYMEYIIPPRIFIIKTKVNLGDYTNIEFFNIERTIRYRLSNIIVNDIDGEKNTIECREWEEKWVDMG
jgi:hypothetical protein